MINKFLILLLVLFAKVFCFGQSKQIKVIGPKYTCIYNKTKGMLNGLYTSYYNNGCEKAQGKFENNTRMGTWTLWDSIGNMTMQRIYDAPFQYTEVFPVKRIIKFDSLFYSKSYRWDTIVYGRHKFLTPFTNYNEKVSRILRKEENQILFQDRFLFKKISNYIMQGMVKAYDSTDDFRIEASYENFYKKLNSHSSDIVAFKLTEIIEFDTVRELIHPAVLGICPIMYNLSTKKEEDLLWFYYGIMYFLFSYDEVSGDKLPSYVKKLSDIFYYNYYSGDIYKEQTVYKRELSDYKIENNNEPDLNKIEALNIEWEHFLWVNWKSYFNSKKRD